MDQLSADIVQTIADVVDYSDIPSFRLTCRAFAAIGLPRQFETIPVMLFRNSLENLRRISQHPVCRNYVLTIEFGPCVVSKPEGREDWIDAVKRRRMVPSSKHLAYSEVELEQAYQSHRWYYDDHEEMKNTGYDFEAFKSAISCFPNLKRLHIARSITRSLGLSKFKNPPPNWGVAFCSMAKVMGRFGCNQFWDLDWGDPARDITSILAACKLAPKALSSFDCEVFDEEIIGCDESHDMTGSVPPSRLTEFVEDPTKDIGFSLVCATFESLTSMKLTLLRSRSAQCESWQEHLGAALCHAQSLEALGIQLPSSHRSNYALLFTTILGSSTWPHLTHLSLSSFRFHEHDLPTFLLRHPSLHTLTLTHAYATDFDWSAHLQSSSLAPHLRQLRSLTLAGNWLAESWTELDEIFLRDYFHYESRYDEPWGLGRPVDLSAVFGKWARDITGARNACELLSRYFASVPGEVPFPLYTGREILEEVARQMEEETWDGSRNAGMIIAAERVVGEQYQNRKLHSNYSEDGEEVGEEFRTCGMNMYYYSSW